MTDRYSRPHAGPHPTPTRIERRIIKVRVSLWSRSALQAGQAAPLPFGAAEQQGAPVSWPQPRGA